MSQTWVNCQVSKEKARRENLLISPEPKLLESEVLDSSSSISLSVRNVWLYYEICELLI